jgi:small-conductance mechanosensitive channel
LTYTWIRTPDDDRLVVPNEKLASDTIRNSTIRSAETRAEASVQVPATADVRGLVESLRTGGDEVYVTDLSDKVTVVVRRVVPRSGSLEAAASQLRLDVYDRLKRAGVIGT